eukprot:TRINITY_DN40122_c0_g1_i1.p1 TRINITY_DN40122_c0_g1~~TRINITY_DN40122_c0_g1_i1.p1  ORF type:complete len:361 (-),score=62.58 TRINITY_DN40122_c0_g1_i1:183-1265(-)
MRVALHCVLSVLPGGTVRARVILPHDPSTSCLAGLPQELLLRICSTLPPRSLGQLQRAALLLGIDRTATVTRLAAGLRINQSQQRSALLRCPLLQLQLLSQLDLYAAVLNTDHDTANYTLLNGADARLGPVGFMESVSSFSGAKMQDTPCALTLTQTQLREGMASVTLLSSSPLIVAARSRSPELCVLLIKHGAEPLQVVSQAQICGHERTALEAAVQCGDPAVAQVVLDSTQFRDCQHIDSFLECVEHDEVRMLMEKAKRGFLEVWGLDDSDRAGVVEHGLVCGPAAFDPLLHQAYGPRSRWALEDKPLNDLREDSERQERPENVSADESRSASVSDDEVLEHGQQKEDQEDTNVWELD